MTDGVESRPRSPAYTESRPPFTRPTTTATEFTVDSQSRAPTTRAPTAADRRRGDGDVFGPPSGAPPPKEPLFVPRPEELLGSAAPPPRVMRRVVTIEEPATNYTTLLPSTPPPVEVVVDLDASNRSLGPASRASSAPKRDEPTSKPKRERSATKSATGRTKSGTKPGEPRVRRLSLADKYGAPRPQLDFDDPDAPLTPVGPLPDKMIESMRGWIIPPAADTAFGYDAEASLR